MTLPNFLVIGPGKTGTTSLHDYLGQHPDIFMTEIKEPDFFCFDGLPAASIDLERRKNTITEKDAYEALFNNVRGESAIGESTPFYFFSKHAAQRIRHHIPDAKLITILRQPVERAYSSFMMRRREGLEPATSFEAALSQKSANTIGKRLLQYLNEEHPMHEYLAAYLRLFSRDQLLITLYDDFQRAPEDFVQSIFRFLAVDDRFVPDMSRWLNVGGEMNSASVSTLLYRPNPVRYAARHLLPRPLRNALRQRVLARSVVPSPRLDPDLRRRLTAEIRDEVLELQRLISRDLSHWLE